MHYDLCMQQFTGAMYVSAFMNEDRLGITPSRDGQAQEV